MQQSSTHQRNLPFRFSLLGFFWILTIASLAVIATIQSWKANDAESELTRLRSSSTSNDTDKYKLGRPHQFGIVAKQTDIVLPSTSGKETYKTGLNVKQVNPNTYASEAGIIAGDTLVAMAGWKIENTDHMDYVFNDIKKNPKRSHRFYVLRNGKFFWGQFKLQQKNAK